MYSISQGKPALHVPWILPPVPCERPMGSIQKPSGLHFYSKLMRITLVCPAYINHNLKHEDFWYHGPSNYFLGDTIKSLFKVHKSKINVSSFLKNRSGSCLATQIASMQPLPGINPDCVSSFLFFQGVFVLKLSQRPLRHVVTTFCSCCSPHCCTFVFKQNTFVFKQQIYLIV